MNLQGASILVTGGCGLIGSATVDLLLREHDPARILILDNLARGSLANVTQALQDPRVRLIRADIRETRETQTSLMPDNFAEALSVDDFNHLLAFLLAQREKPAH